MNNLKCERCGKKFPMNEMVQTSEKKYCIPCTEEALQDPDEPLEGNVERLIDPTICVRCGFDNGRTALGFVAELPVCQQCEAYYRNRPFPQWIKAASVALIFLVCFSLWWNMRFFQAYGEMTKSYELWGEGDISEASKQMASASDKVPESQDLRLTAVYFRGILCLNEDKCREALDLLKQCENNFHPDFGVDNLIIHARMGLAFDESNYDEFLSCAKIMCKKYPNETMNIASVASAYACKYVETGNEEYQTEALDNLSKAKKMANDDPNFREYEERILHRIDTKDIISREEFVKRYPAGYDR